MAEQNLQKASGRKRVNRMKKAILLFAAGLILASVILNIVLLVRVVQLNHLIQQLYGLVF